MLARVVTAHACLLVQASYVRKRTLTAPARWTRLCSLVQMGPCLSRLHPRQIRILLCGSEQLQVGHAHSRIQAWIVPRPQHQPHATPAAAPSPRSHGSACGGEHHQSHTRSQSMPVESRNRAQHEVSSTDPEAMSIARHIALHVDSCLDSCKEVQSRVSLMRRSKSKHGFLLHRVQWRRQEREERPGKGTYNFLS